MVEQRVVELKDVWKRYDMGKAGNLIVLKEINLEINKGEFVAIVGPSGSGKSTMMNMVGALDLPSFGEIRINGQNISEMSESQLAILRGKSIGFIFQQFNLLPNLTALKNVTLPMEIIEKEGVNIEERAKKLLTMLGLQDRLNHKPSELSGGQQQRVAIARSLANDAPIVLADEPTGNLDSKTGKFIMDFLSRICREEEKTVILITHDLELVSYADKIIYIKDGKIERIVNKKMKGGKN